MKKVAWTSYIILLVISVIALASGFNPITVMSGFLAMFTAPVSVISATTITGSVIQIFGLTAMMLIGNIVFSVTKPKAVKDIDFDFFKHGPIPAYLTIIFEELFARVLFLKLLATWIHASHPILLIIMGIGNAIWTLVHILNFEGSLKDRIITMLPIFAMGFFLGYLYLAYGFWLTLFVHFTHNAIAWAGIKRRETFAANKTNLIYWFIVGTITLVVVSVSGVHLSMLLPLINNFSIVGITPFSMIVLLVGISSILGVITNALHLDHVINAESLEKLPSKPEEIILAYVIGELFIVGMIIVISLGLAYFFPLLSPITIALIISAIVILLNKPKSESAFANLWFTYMIPTTIQVFVVLTFGFWAGLMIIFITDLFSIFPAVVALFDNQ